MTIEFVVTLVVQSVTLIAGGVSLYISLLLAVAKLSERIKVLEVMFEQVGRKAAKALHSPHDPYGIDPLLDKYLDRHYELSIEEWRDLHNRCAEIEEMEDISKEQRFLAGMLSAVCWHKLRIDPPLRREQPTTTR